MFYSIMVFIMGATPYLLTIFITGYWSPNTISQEIFIRDFFAFIIFMVFILVVVVVVFLHQNLMYF